jgi:hypothetical protein
VPEIDPQYTHDESGIEIVLLDPRRPHDDPDERGCPHCGQEAYFSGCDAGFCSGWGCQDCSEGCDRDFVSTADGGRCARASDDLLKTLRDIGRRANELADTFEQFRTTEN